MKLLKKKDPLKNKVVLNKFDYIDKDGDLWRYVIRYNSNENDLALFDKAKFGNKLKFCKRGDY